MASAWLASTGAVVKRAPEVLFNVHLCIISELRARMKVSERADAETVWRMKLTSEKFTAGVLHFEKLQNVGGRQ